MNRKKVWTKTAKNIKCKATGLKLTEANKSKHNSRAFYKLGNGEYLSRSNEAMRKFLDDKYPDRVEHDGENLDEKGKPSLDEQYRALCKKYGYEI